MADRGRAAIILAGGRSVRMGTDKAQLVVDGSPMLSTVIEAASAHVDRIVVSGPDHLAPPRDLASVPVEVLPDAAEGLGPLGGVVTAWGLLSSTPPVPGTAAVLSCDLPGLTSDVVERLFAAAESAPTVDAVVADDGSRPQPLVGVYRAASLDHAASAFVQGERSLRRLFRGWSVRAVEFAEDIVSDADTPEDLAGRRVDWPEGDTPGG